MDARSEFAVTAENQLRQRGIDANAQLQGDQRDVLLIDWRGARGSDIYAFVTSSAVREAAAKGFSAITFTNGKQQWEYDVSRESMVTSPVLF